MTDHSYLADAAPYVLDAMDDLERARFERHLAGCDECRAEVASLRVGLDADADAHAVPPPAAVRASVLEQLDETPQVGARSTARRWLVGSIAAAVAIVVAFAAVLTLTGPPSVSDLLARSDTVVQALGATEAYTGSATADAVVAGDGSTIYLRFDGLEENDPDLTYQAWLIDPVTGATPAGLFSPDDDGSVVLRLDGTRADGLLVGVTLEPAEGSLQPTGDVLFLGELS